MIPFLKKPFSVPLLLIVLSVLLAAIAEFIQLSSIVRPATLADRTEKKLHVLEQKMSASLDEIATLKTDSAFHKYFIHQGFQQIGFSFFSIEHEAITRWSDNETDITSLSADTCESNTLIHLNNGWYEIFIRKDAGKEIIGLILIRKEYAYENQYLVNSFNPQLDLPATTDITNVPGETSFKVHSKNGQVLFGVQLLNTQNESLNLDTKSWLYIFSFLLFMLAVFLAGRILVQVYPGFTFILVLLLIGARIWMIHLHIPDEFYSTLLFSPQFYASSFYFNSLGDLFLNAMILFSITGILFSAFASSRSMKRDKPASDTGAAGILVFIFLLSMLLHNLISGLVMNSKISFDVSNIFGINEYSLLGFLVIAVLLCSWFMIAFALLKRYFKGIPYKKFCLLLLISVSVFALTYLLTQHSDISALFSPEMSVLALIMIVLIFTVLKKDEEKINLNFLLTVTLLFSMYSSFSIWKLNDRKEKDNRKLLAQKIETGQDQLAEYLFEDLGEKISKDPIIQHYFKDTLLVREQVSKRLMQFYFTGYWGKFNITISCFDRDGLPFGTLRTELSLDTLLNKIADSGTAYKNPRLYFVGNESGQQQYISIIHMQPDKAGDLSAGSIVVMLTPKLFKTDEGFPELFVSRKVAFNKELNKYSYARYENDSLVNQSGAFAYYFTPGVFHPSQQEYSFTDRDGYNHLIHRVNASTLILVSKSTDSSLVLVTLFSYLFTIFSALLFLVYLLWRILNRDIHYHLNLTRRIQFSVMLLVILSFFLIGSGTVYYITHKYDVNKDESIRDKIKFLITIVEKELGDIGSLTTELSDETQASLIRLSGMLGADFNLFNAEGNLSYSSQPKIFEQGIISKKMNPEAFHKMSQRGRTQFIQTESIGKLNYISVYEPFRSRLGKVTGFLHLPYFEKQNELNNEISNFLSALINIYVLLFALAVIVTLFISSRITKPLGLIQEKLSNIRLGMKNEPIEYRQSDEIGELVKEYNRMIEELSASAEKLARSERESAWREMAKQVAHEIKNPLTPMKLSVQHLQKAWEEKSPQLNDIFQRISQTLVQQIDTLSNIATEFSNFAQMPQPKKEPADLGKTLESVIDLFKELPGISIVFTNDNAEKIVLADKDQLIRMFSNLFKNAIQAIPSGKEGIITVSVSTVGDQYVVSVNDNGAGISPDQIGRIFTPSFTTKSGGMGLGLSIVKSIVESSGGKIWFETKEHTGTTFYISLPMLKKHA